MYQENNNISLRKQVDKNKEDIQTLNDGKLNKVEDGITGEDKNVVSVINKTLNNIDALNRNTILTVKTVEELVQTEETIQVGDVVEVLGYYTAGDGAGHKRVIADSDDGSGVQLDNGLYANIVPNSNGNDKMDKGDVNPNLSNAEKIVKAIESNQGLKFGTILNIDDVGTKQEGYCYMFEGDIYKCLAENDEVTPESAYFQPISNNKLSDRLDNLEEHELTYITPLHQCLSYNSSLRRVGNSGIVFLALNSQTPITYETIVIGKLAHTGHDPIEYLVGTLNIRIENGEIKLRCSDNSINFGWVAILTIPILLKL